MNHIDAIYYINLDHRTDRNESILNQLAPFNHSNIIRVPGVIARFGAIGCGLAHIECIQRFIKSSFQNCLILEDDFEFVKPPNEVNAFFNKFYELNIGYDMLLLAGVIKHIKHSNIPFLAKVIDVQTTSAYVLTKHYANVLLTNFTDAVNNLKRYDKPLGKYCIDIYWKLLQPLHNWYITNPKLGHQLENNYSDNERRIVRYNEQLEFVLTPKQLVNVIFITVNDFSSFNELTQLAKVNQINTQLLHKTPQTSLCAIYCVFYDDTKPFTYFHINEQYKYIILGKKAPNGIQLMILLSLFFKIFTYASKLSIITESDMEILNIPPKELLQVNNSEICFYTPNSFTIGIQHVKTVLNNEKALIAKSIQHIIECLHDLIVDHETKYIKPKTLTVSSVIEPECNNTQLTFKSDNKPQTKSIDPDPEPVMLKPKIDLQTEIVVSPANIEFLLNSMIFSVTKNINSEYGAISQEFSNKLQHSIYNTVNASLEKIQTLNHKRQLRLTKN
jgi:hypothetical protein